MKQNLHPAVIAVVIVVAVALAGFFLRRAVVDKPAYPGQMAGHPGQGPMKPPPMVNGKMTPEMAQKMGFTGAAARK